MGATIYQREGLVCPKAPRSIPKNRKGLPPTNIQQYLQTFWWPRVMVQRGCYWHLMIEARDAAKHPTVHRINPCAKNYPKWQWYPERKTLLIMLIISWASSRAESRTPCPEKERKGRAKKCVREVG